MSHIAGWSLKNEEFIRRVRRDALNAAARQSERGEALPVTEEAGRVESKIDEKVKELYGL